MDKENNLIPSLQTQLNILSQRLNDIERRLSFLERSMVPARKAAELRGKDNPKPEQIKRPLHHNYLRKTIDAARRRYEREHNR